MPGRVRGHGRSAAILEAVGRKPGPNGSGDPGSTSDTKPLGEQKRVTLEAVQPTTSSPEPTQTTLPLGIEEELNLSEPKPFASTGAIPRTPRRPLRRQSPPQQTFPTAVQPSASGSSTEEPPSRAMSCLNMQEKSTVKMSSSYSKCIKVTANYIRLYQEKGKWVYEYEVQFDPDISSRGLRINMVNRYMQEVGGVIFDGGTLYLPIKLKNERCTYIGAHPGDQSMITITLIYKQQRSMGECVHMHNVLFRRIKNMLEFAHFGGEHLYPYGSHKVPQTKLEVWPGLVTALEQYDGGIELCIHSSHSILRTQSVLDLMQDLLEWKQGPMSDYQREVHRLVNNNSVFTKHTNKVYCICDIAWNMDPSSTFTMHDGTEIVLKDYYRENYQLNVTDMGQPLLISRIVTNMHAAKPIEQLVCLIPEFCYFTDLTDATGSGFKVLKKISAYTRITPTQRVAALQQYIENIRENPKARALLSDWGVGVQNDAVEMSDSLDEWMLIFTTRDF